MNSINSNYGTVRYGINSVRSKCAGRWTMNRAKLAPKKACSSPPNEKCARQAPLTVWHVLKRIESKDAYFYDSITLGAGPKSFGVEPER